MSEAAETPIEDLVADALRMMAEGAHMRLSDRPGDGSMLSASYGGKVSVALASRLEAVTRERDEARAEAERLRARVSLYFKLREEWDHMVRYGRDPGEEREAALDDARAALEGK